MTKRMVMAGVALVAAVIPAAASAAIITQTFAFTGTGFNGVGNGPPPLTTVTGSVTVTYDTSVTVIDQLGASAVVPSVPFASPIRYSYYSSFDGGTLSFASGGYNPSIANAGQGFALTFRNVGSGQPQGVSLNYALAGNNELFSTRNVTITAGPAEVSGAVPEPATWAMLLLGFGGIGATLRRRATGRPMSGLRPASISSLHHSRAS